MIPYSSPQNNHLEHWREKRQQVKEFTNKTAKRPKKPTQQQQNIQCKEGNLN